MDSVAVDLASEQYFGEWKRLVSTTNWDKGRIIFQWRKALEEAGAPADQFSDDAWGRRVRSVTAQHIGRLRRTYQRFAETRDTYRGLYWSHFQAALDWDDAEMWLEGAVHNGWSVSEMRRQRGDALGAPDNLKPGPNDVSTAHLKGSAGATGHSSALTANGAREEVRDPGDKASRRRTARQTDADSTGRSTTAHDPSQSAAEPRARSKFADLPSLPADVSEAFEAFKLCILRHKLAGFEEIARDELAATLDALKELIFAPAE